MLKSAKNDHEETRTLAQTMHELMKEKRVSVSEMAQALNLPEMTIRRLVSGKTTDPKLSTLSLIANYFNIPIDVLIGNTQLTLGNDLLNTTPQFVPIVTWEIANKISSIHDLDLTHWKDWQTVPLKSSNTVSPEAFALTSRPSLYPRYPKDTLFIIDPDATPTDGDILLIKINDTHELTLKELHVDPPIWLLKSLVSESEKINYSETSHRIVGVVLLTLLYKHNT